MRAGLGSLRRCMSVRAEFEETVFQVKVNNNNSVLEIKFEIDKENINMVQSIKWGLWVAGLLATSDAGASPSVVLAGMFADDMGLPAPLATVGTPEVFSSSFFGGVFRCRGDGCAAML